MSLLEAKRRLKRYEVQDILNRQEELEQVYHFLLKELDTKQQERLTIHWKNHYYN